jgi:hypothetical protein
MKPCLLVFAVLVASIVAVGAVFAETIVLQPGPEEGKDTYICDCEPDQNNPNGPITHVYQGQYGSCYDRMLIEWNLSSLPAGATVTSATMELWFNQLWGSESGEMVYYPVLEYWEETQVTYNTQPAYSQDDSVVTGWPQANNSWHAVDITEFVQMWHDGTLANHGIYGHCLNTVSTCCAEFNSSDVANEGQRPRLTIEYSGQTASEPETHSHAVRLDLGQNCPNPFSGSTVVRYSLGEPSAVSVSVCDLLGREVLELVRSHASAGCYSVSWTAHDVPSGTYLILMQAGGRKVVRKATVVSSR